MPSPARECTGDDKTCTRVATFFLLTLSHTVSSLLCGCHMLRTSCVLHACTLRPEFIVVDLYTYIESPVSKNCDRCAFGGRCVTKKEIVLTYTNNLRRHISEHLQGSYSCESICSAASKEQRKQKETTVHKYFDHVSPVL
jgi:hypothetical protein